jgi:hypothetical protein
MASNSESGHAKNVANFHSLISVINGFGAAYTPSNQSVTVGKMEALAQNAANSLSVVNGALGSNSIKIAARKEAIKPLSKLSTRILNSLRSSDVTKQIVDSAQSLVRKIQGQRATKKLTAEQKETLKAEGIVKKEVSSSQMSIDSRIESFDKLIQFLSGIPQYAPNEIELQVSSLTNYNNTLKTVNNDVREADTELNNVRIARNEILYMETTGLVAVATAAKTYIKSLFGATNPKYKQVSGLRFIAIGKNKISNDVFIANQATLI